MEGSSPGVTGWKQLSSLEWTQPNVFSREFQLMNGQSLVADLTFQSAFGSRALAHAAGMAWTFKRTGIFTAKVTARIEGSDPDIAVYEPNFTGSRGTIALQSGERLVFKTVNFWNTEWALLDATERLLLSMHNKGILRQGAATEIAPAGRERDDLPLLASLAWYVLYLHMSDASSAS